MIRIWHQVPTGTLSRLHPDKPNACSLREASTRPDFASRPAPTMAPARLDGERNGPKAHQGKSQSPTSRRLYRRDDEVRARAASLPLDQVFPCFGHSMECARLFGVLERLQLPPTIPRRTSAFC